MDRSGVGMNPPLGSSDQRLARGDDCLGRNSATEANIMSRLRPSPRLGLAGEQNQHDEQRRRLDVFRSL